MYKNESKTLFYHPFHGLVWWLSDINWMEAYFHSFLLPSLPLFTFFFVLSWWLISEFLSGRTIGSGQNIFQEYCADVWKHQHTLGFWVTCASGLSALKYWWKIIFLCIHLGWLGFPIHAVLSTEVPSGCAWSPTLDLSISSFPVNIHFLNFFWLGTVRTTWASQLNMNCHFGHFFLCWILTALHTRRCKPGDWASYRRAEKKRGSSEFTV